MTNEPTSPAWTIRPALDSDLNDLAELYCEYVSEYANRPDVTKMREFLADVIGEGWLTIWVAESDQLLGFLTTALSYSPLSMCRALALNDLYVRNAWRNRGIAHNLVESASESARNVAIRKMYLQAAPHLVPLYKKWGFTPFDYVSMFAMVEGQPRQSVE
jgi:N-acetylglutamate synthase-like GNAT family acetyltransferase